MQNQEEIYSQHEVLSKNKNPWAKIIKYEKESTKNIINMLQKIPHDSILEVGCADGKLTKELIKYADTVVGIDVSSSAVERARKKVSKAKFFVSSLEDYSTKEKFDLIICSEVLYYIKDEKKALSKLKKLGRHLITSHFFVYFPQFCLGSVKYEFYLSRFPVLQTIIEKDLKLGLLVIKRLRRI